MRKDVWQRQQHELVAGWGRHLTEAARKADNKVAAVWQCELEETRALLQSCLASGIPPVIPSRGMYRPSLNGPNWQAKISTSLAHVHRTTCWNFMHCVVPPWISDCECIFTDSNYVLHPSECPVFVFVLVFCSFWLYTYSFSLQSSEPLRSVPWRYGHWSAKERRVVGDERAIIKNWGAGERESRTPSDYRDHLIICDLLTSAFWSRYGQRRWWQCVNCTHTASRQLPIYLAIQHIYRPSQKLKFFFPRAYLKLLLPCMTQDRISHGAKQNYKTTWHLRYGI